MILTSTGSADRITRSTETHPLTWHLCEDAQSVWLEEYQSKDGYAATHKALTQVTQDDIVQTVKDLSLKSRGGAGFPTGVKWGLMPRDESLNIRYPLYNANEMEPDAWKNRTLMEQLPHLLMEGMLVSTYAPKAYRGYIFPCDEYVDAARDLNCAIDEAKAAGLLGKNILSSDSDFELSAHTGADYYIHGEETTLINPLEDRRANPRSRSPFPIAVGVWSKPTRVNNMETLCSMPTIVGNGANWHKTLARPGSEDMGIKLMGFSGKVKNPGLWELPFGVGARELFEDYVGGIRGGFQFRARQPGDTGTGFLFPEHLDAQMFVGGIAKVDTRMGTDLAMVMGDSINMVSLLRNIKGFFAREPCGQCTPCRDGLP